MVTRDTVLRAILQEGNQTVVELVRDEEDQRFVFNSLA